MEKKRFRMRPDQRGVLLRDILQSHQEGASPFG